MFEDTKNNRPGLLIVRRVYFEQFATGTKSIEYRRHRGAFTVRNFWVGRRIRVAYSYSYQAQGPPYLVAEVVFFGAEPVLGKLLFDLQETYPEMREGDEVALIGLHVLGRHGR